MTRLFPMLDGPPIPWPLAEIVFQAYGTGGQSLERIAEGGGFGWGEVSYLFKELKRRRPSFHAELLARAASGMSASGQDAQQLEAKPASPTPKGDAQ